MSTETAPRSAAQVQPVVMRYEHDCDYCIPLGQWQEYDLYYCPNEPTVVARYGELGDYMSGLWAADKMEPLGKAKALAVERGLIDA